MVLMSSDRTGPSIKVVGLPISQGSQVGPSCNRLFASLVRFLIVRRGIWGAWIHRRWGVCLGRLAGRWAAAGNRGLNLGLVVIFVDNHLAWKLYLTLKREKQLP